MQNDYSNDDLVYEQNLKKMKFIGIYWFTAYEL